MKQMCFDLHGDDGYNITREYYNHERMKWVTMALVRHSDNRGGEIDIPTKYITNKRWDKRYIYFRGMKDGEPVYFDDNDQEMLVFESDEDGYYHF